jgi:signal transduction histidine kinase
VQWELPDLPRLQLGAAAVLNLQRLLLEAFTNVLQHAQAQQLRLEAGVAEGRLILRLSDDGVGLGVSSASAGAGLAAMQAQALKLGAELQLLPAQPQGLCVCLRMPLRTSPG